MLTPYGLSTWLPITVIAAVLVGTAVLLGWWWAAVPLAVVWAAVAWFFRDPLRRIDPDLPAPAALSPADGRVSSIHCVPHHDATGGPALIIRIFLSVLNVHVNRSPVDAKVVAMQHTPGKFLDARTEASAALNESNLLTLGLPDGRTIGLRQVAGKVARRIVCPVEVGEQLRRGQKYGMIKFGSTAELILPDPQGVEVKVSVGQRVKGGCTVLARMAPPSPESKAHATDDVTGPVSEDR